MGTEWFQATLGCQAFAQAACYIAARCSKAAVSQRVVASRHAWLTNGLRQTASQACSLPLLVCGKQKGQGSESV